MRDSVLQLRAHVLWTGGWDSTYRVLELLLGEQREVQTYYVLDRRRPSLERELATMERLRGAIRDHDRRAGERLLPTIFAERDQLRPDPEVTAAYRRVLEHRPLGSQYEWLALFQRQTGREDLELCTERLREHGPHSLFPYLLGREHFPNFVPPAYYDQVAADLRLLLGAFRLPLTAATKLEMADNARRSGWMELMKLTWFCFHPKRGGRPCGRCSPCRQVRRAGLGWRISLYRRFLARTRELWRSR